MSGDYALATGKDLRDLPIPLMYDVAYAFLRKSSLRTEEEHKVLRQIDQQLVDTEVEMETGLPTFVRQFAPADQLTGRLPT